MYHKKHECNGRDPITYHGNYAAGRIETEVAAELSRGFRSQLRCSDVLPPRLREFILMAPKYGGRTKRVLLDIRIKTHLTLDTGTKVPYDEGRKTSDHRGTNGVAIPLRRTQKTLRLCFHESPRSGGRSIQIMATDEYGLGRSDMKYEIDWTEPVKSTVSWVG